MKSGITKCEDPRKGGWRLVDGESDKAGQQNTGLRWILVEVTRRVVCEITFSRSRTSATAGL